MFGYIKKSKVLRIIQNGQEQLREKENQLILNGAPEDESEKLEVFESICKLDGGIYFLECLKKHFS